MRIGFVIGQTYAGGMERQLAYLCYSLAQRGHEVFVYTVSGNNRTPGREKVDISDKIIYPLYFTKYTKYFSTFYFKLLIQKHSPDLLVAFQVGSIELCKKMLGLNSFKFKIVGNLRGIKFSVDRELAIRYMNACKEIDGIICNSKSGYDLAKQHLNINDNSVLIRIPNIVTLGKSDQSIVVKRWKILFAGSLKDVKDPLTFIKGIMEVLKTNRNVEVTIAGGGYLEEKMKKIVADVGMQKYFNFLGFVKPENVPYSSSHIVISSSLREASSNSILEGLAHGCLVIGTDTGGTTELLKGTPYGKLFPVGDYLMLSKHIIEFMNLNPIQLSNARNMAKDYINGHHNINDVTNEYEKLLKEILNEE
ncbi:MAG: hypothetical protein BM564_13000 [Bacteroidetes bacterium MedPE-SWsnd-G2]|nr:MAG: hypothetical protein BM564_13000 [Bacteroidetes bacterium MedPE-SWsnd-G2]